MENALGQRFAEVLNYYAISESDLSKLIFVSKQTLSNIRIVGNPTYATLDSVIKYFKNINARWFMTGEGSMLGVESNVVTEPDSPYRSAQVIEKLCLEDRRELIKIREMNHSLMEELMSIKKGIEKKEAG